MDYFVATIPTLPLVFCGHATRKLGQCKSCSLIVVGDSSLKNFRKEITSGLPTGPRSNCWMFATLPTNISGVTIAPHENPN
jgi:hypothetical protein